MVYQPHFLRERKHLDDTPKINLLSLPHKIRSLIYAYLFNGKAFSNKGRDKFFSEIWRARDENGMINRFPQGLNILLVCRQLNTEATYALHHERSCIFRLEVNAVKIFNGYHTPFPSHMTIKQVVRLLIVIRLDVYGALHPAQKEAWRLYLEKSSLEARRYCLILLIAVRPVKLHLLEGLAGLLRTFRRCKHVEIMIIPDMKSCRVGSIYGSFGRENVSVPKDWVDLMKGLEGVLESPDFGKAKTWAPIVFDRLNNDDIHLLGKAEIESIGPHIYIGLGAIMRPLHETTTHVDDTKLTRAEIEL